MKGWHDDQESAGMEHIIRALKKPLHLDETFELRVMSAVHADALANIDAGGANHGGDHWWSKRYTLRFTALGGLAAVASIAVAIALAAKMSPRSAPVARSAVSQHSAFSIPTVDFVLVHESANQVYLVGDFNDWSKKRTPLKRTANRSAWTVSVPLDAGKHEYAFIVDDENGEHWVADPLSTKVEDEFGTESSIVRIGPTSS